MKDLKSVTMDTTEQNIDPLCCPRCGSRVDTVRVDSVTHDSTVTERYLCEDCLVTYKIEYQAVNKAVLS